MHIFIPPFNKFVLRIHHVKDTGPETLEGDTLAYALIEECSRQTIQSSLLEFRDWIVYPEPGTGCGLRQT